MSYSLDPADARLEILLDIGYELERIADALEETNE